MNTKISPTSILSCLALVAITGLSGFGGFASLCVIAWLFVSLVTVKARFGMTDLVRPPVMIYWVGILPSVIPLLYFESFEVGVPSTNINVSFIWLLSNTALLLTVVAFSRHDRVEVRPSAEISTLFRKALFPSGILLVTFSIALHLRIISATGNIFNAENPEAERTALEAGNGATLTLAMAFLMLGSSFLAARFALSSRGFKLQFIPATFGLSLVIVGVLALQLTGTRLLVVRTLLAIFIVFFYVKRGRPPLSALVILSMALLLLFASVGQTRYVGGERTLVEIVGDRTSSGVQVGALIVDHAASEGHWFGEAVFAPFLTYLPGPQSGLGYLLKDALGLSYSGGGVATPLPAEGYLDFGWLGVILYAILAGVLVATLDQIGLANRSVWGGIAVASLGITMTGLTAGLGTTLAMYLLPLIALLVFFTALPKLLISGGTRQRMDQLPQKDAR